MPREAYAGIESKLKHVCAVGRAIESGPERCRMNLSFSRPPIGARSHPVAKRRSARFSAGVKPSTTWVGEGEGERED